MQEISKVIQEILELDGNMQESKKKFDNEIMREKEMIEEEVKSLKFEGHEKADENRKRLEKKYTEETTLEVSQIRNERNIKENSIRKLLESNKESIMQSALDHLLSTIKEM